jgi:NCS1 family nucleobase:cation symporter-1
MDEPIIATGAMRVTIAVVALLGVAIATISTNIAANVVSPANDFANLAPRLISFRTGGVITGILGIVIMPWKLLASADTYIFEWLVGYSALLGPIAGIMIADYWIVRKRELDVPDLYRTTGRYAGINWRAMTALVLGIAPNVPGFLGAVKVLKGDPTVWDAIYPYAWFTGFLLAGVVYLGMTAVLKSRRNWTGKPG